ncbi:galactosyltransferase-related protein [Acinetobacter larvae]|uniref:galactosyltransferase-related protein n=1 Tax=Acinetobacter larvae TaxID=1789224 RepID=UPI001E364559|nr:galactosyltransferase-related protein [Acinetobacter larvae]
MTALPNDLDLSIIIPIDFNRRAWNIYQHCKLLKTQLNHHNVQVILGCVPQPAFWYKRLINLFKDSPNIHIVQTNTQSSHLSELRNQALQQVTTTYVMFLDIDIYCSFAQIQQSYLDVLAHPQQICMYPCLYLSAKGSKKINRLKPNDFKKAYFHFKRDLILHLAFPSSIIICDMQSVQKINGFDPAYIGHGYEDFDFMLRLFHHKELLSYSPEILIDEPYRAPLMSRGFRAMMAEIQLEQLLEDNYFIHLYHKKNKQERYYQKRNNNQAYFLEKFQHLINTESTLDRAPPYLLQQFFQLLKEKQHNRLDYAVLWAELEGHWLR